MHVVKAMEGDSILLEASDDKGFVLIDGGPAGVWDNNLRPHLSKVFGGVGSLAAVVVSHVDRDHIVGVLDLLADNERRTVDGEPADPAVAELWHNAFALTIDTQNDIAPALQAVLTKSQSYGVALADAPHAFFGVADGERLRREAMRANIPINAAFGGAILSPDSLPEPTRQVAGIRFTVLGPTSANLEALREEWRRWAERVRRTQTAEALANVDRSVPNLSSIVLLVEQNGRTVLMTGDARGDHIEQGLDQAGLRPQGRFHVDVLKLQHHGSKRNTERGFFERNTADVYVVSANGRHGNPDYETLVWIVETAHAAGRSIEIVATYDTDSIVKLRESHPPHAFGYRLRLPDEGAHAVIVEL